MLYTFFYCTSTTDSNKYTFKLTFIFGIESRAVVELMEYSFPHGSSGGRLQCSQECHCSKETSCYPTKVWSLLLH